MIEKLAELPGQGRGLGLLQGVIYPVFLDSLLDLLMNRSFPSQQIDPLPTGRPTDLAWASLTRSGFIAALREYGLQLFV